MSLPRNEHPVDRIARIVIGLGLFAAVAAGAVAAPVAYVALAIAAIALVTGATGFCPLYAIIGVSTRRPAQR
jgi:hypothetical protein